MSPLKPFKIFVWRTSLSCYNIMKAIPEVLSYSQELVWKFKKVTQRSMSILRSYHIHTILPQFAFWPWPSLKDQKGQSQHQTCLRFWKYPCKVLLQHDTSNSWGLSTFTGQLDLELVECSKRSHTVNGEHLEDCDMETISVKLHDTGTLWRVIVFTWCCQTSMPHTTCRTPT